MMRLCGRLGLVLGLGLGLVLAGCGGEVGEAPDASGGAAPGGNALPGVAPFDDVTCDRGGRCIAGAPLLAHARHRLTLWRGSIFAADVATSSNEQAVSIQSIRTACTCDTRLDHGTTFRQVDVTTPCTAGEERTCFDHIEAASYGPGEAVIEASNGVASRQLVAEVRDVASVVLAARMEKPSGKEGRITFAFGPALVPKEDGAIEVRVGEIAQVEVMLHDDLGRLLRSAGDGDFVASAEDVTMLGRLGDPSGDVGRAPVRFKAIEVGTSRVLVHGRGVRGELPIRVVP